MATNLGLMIHADRRQMLGEMAGMARNAPIAPPQHSEEPASAASFSDAMGAAVRDVDAQNRLASEKWPMWTAARATTWSARC